MMLGSLNNQSGVAQKILMETVKLASSDIVSNSEDERALVEAARCDPAAFSRLYHRYVSRVYRYLYKLAENQIEAEDLTSQVFTEAMEGLAHYQERGNFTAWLFTIARRKAIAARRHQRPTLQLDDVDELPGPAEDPLQQLIQSEQIEQMATLFARLNDDQRELLRLRFTAGLSFADIGAILGRSQAATKMAVYRLLHKMNKNWKE
ncbi:MAG: sigma-70 family RNA polymerase sigma factor [Anaerolineales bacterium]